MMSRRGEAICLTVAMVLAASSASEMAPCDMVIALVLLLLYSRVQVSALVRRTKAAAVSHGNLPGMWVCRTLEAHLFRICQFALRHHLQGPAGFSTCGTMITGGVEFGRRCWLVKRISEQRPRAGYECARDRILHFAGCA